MNTSDEDREIYDVIFDNALSMFRAAKETGDTLGLSIAQSLFSVANEWERDPSHFSPDVFDAAFQVAIEWERVTGDETI